MIAKPLFVSLATKRGTNETSPVVTVYLDGEPVSVPSQASLAAGLIAAGVTRFRNTGLSGAPRAPYCMMGVCYECLVEIDDMPSQQACLTRPSEGMRIRTMSQLPGLAFYDDEGQPLAAPMLPDGDAQ